MAFQEDVSVFFDTVNGFAVPATWQPSWGGPLKSGNVILDTPDVVVGAFRQDAISTDYRATFATVDFIGLKEDEYITVNSIKFRTHETPRLLADGAISEMSLERVV